MSSTFVSKYQTVQIGVGVIKYTDSIGLFQ